MDSSRSRALSLALLLACAGCTSFATVRSAEVQPGPSSISQASATTPPGASSYWFWAWDCFDCNLPISGGDIGFALGRDARRPYTIGGGLNGIFPYVEGYVQLDRSAPRPYGVGARLGIPLIGWSNHQIYARYDVPLDDGRKLLLNPAMFLQTGSSPNGQERGHFLALVQGVGLQRGDGNGAVVPAIALGLGAGKRESYGRDIGPFFTAFLAASVSITLQPARNGPAAPYTQ